MPLFLLSSLMMVAADAPATTDGQVPPSEVQSADAAESDVPVTLRNQVRAAMRDTRGTATRPPSADAARRLLQLYVQLEQDDQLRDVERRRLLGTVRARLSRVAGLLEQGLRRRQNDAGENEEPPQPENVDLPDDRGEVLAQQQPGFPPGGVPRQPGAAPPGAPADYGQELVDLIRETIAVPSWDVNGGQGTIYYFQPLRVLVIRQTSEVHGRIGGVLNQMRGN